MKKATLLALLTLPIACLADNAEVQASIKPPSEFLNDVAEVGAGIAEQYRIPIGSIVEGGVTLLESSPRYLGLEAGEVDAVPGRVSGLINRMARGDLPRAPRPGRGTHVLEPGEQVPFLDRFNLGGFLGTAVGVEAPPGDQPIVVKGE